jgi:hypothetical protein
MIDMPMLQPLNTHADPGVRYFSGIATSSTSFSRPAGLRHGRPVWLDLGTVADVAQVSVNGRPAGITCFAPDRVDIGPLLVAGRNQIEVSVANRWINRLIGDRQPGLDRVTFTAAPTYRPDAPLVPSGLMGPVRVYITN